MNKELVSVIIPTYKRSDSLIRAINSVLLQTYSPLEIIVVDDNEFLSEESLIVQKSLEEYINDTRVRYVAQEVHTNGAAARNNGIKVAKGNYIAFLDDDDEWLPSKIEKQMKILQQDDHLGGVSCLYSIYENGNEIRKCKPYTSDNLQFKILRRDVAICMPTFLAKREVLDKIGAFNEKLVRHQDLQLFVDFLDCSEIVPLNEYLVRINVDSKINKPDITTIISVKEKFFELEKDVLQKYSKKDLKRIVDAHRFEIILVAFRVKKFSIIFKYLLQIGFAFSSYQDVIRRYNSRSL